MYIGRNIDSINNISTLDNLSFNGSDATFNLTQNSVAFVLVSADAVTTAKINDGAVTSSKIASGVVPTLRPNAQAIIINGDCSISQRGTSVSSANSSGYKAIDRYRHTISIGTWTISQSTDSPSDEGFGYSMKMDCTTAEASPGSTDALAFVQKIEGQDLQLLKKGTSNAEKLTVAFWVKCTKTGTAQVNLVDEDNTRMIGQQFTVNATNTWEKKVLSFNADTSGALGNDNGSSLRLEIWLDAGSSYKSGATPTSWESLNTADYFAGGTLNLGDNTSNDIYITGIQLEVGEFSSATLPNFQHESFGDNLARCQRYCQVYKTESAYGMMSPAGVSNTTTAFGIFTFPTYMRTIPSLSTSGSFGLYSGDGGDSVSSIVIDANSDDASRVVCTISGSGFTDNSAAFLRANNDSSAKMTFNAEL